MEYFKRYLSEAQSAIEILHMELQLEAAKKRIEELEEEVEKLEIELEDYR